MDELRHIHLGAPKPNLSVIAQLQAAYAAALGLPDQRQRA